MSKQIVPYTTPDTVLSKLDTARAALAEAKTIQDTKQIMDVAAGAEVFFKQSKACQEDIDLAHYIMIEAQRQIGVILKQTERNRGAQGIGTSAVPEEDHTPTLAELKITKNKSSLYQKIADLPQEQYEQVRAGNATITKALREVTHANRPIVISPVGKYRVIYADPPWSYGNSGLQQYGHASFHYPSMTIEELCALPIESIAEDNSVLFLWVTSPLLAECFAVIEAWGFEYKTSFIWDKVKHNMGHYNSVRHEFLLVCTRGSCTPDVKTLHDSVQSIERSEKHSEKPEEFRTIIESLYTSGARIELFAREAHQGWTMWGNEPSQDGGDK